MREIELEFVWAPLLDAIDRGAHQGAKLAADVVAERAKHNAPHRTGALKNSIIPQEPKGTFSGGDLEVVVGAGVEYAPYVEFGTGIHGPNRRMIEPVKAQALRIPIGGNNYIYRMSSQGMKPRPYMRPAAEEAAPLAADACARAIDLALTEYGKSRS